MSTPAIEKMERRLAALEKRISDALLSPTSLPDDWDRLVDSSADLVDRIVDAERAHRARMDNVVHIPIMRDPKAQARMAEILATVLRAA